MAKNKMSAWVWVVAVIGFALIVSFGFVSGAGLIRR